MHLPRLCFCSVALAAILAGPAPAARGAPAPLLRVLPRFTAAAVPAWGPSEVAVDPPTWTDVPTAADAHLPGAGIRQHPMLYIGEGCNTMFVVQDGKVIWTYSTGKGWEFDDIWMLTNGNILFSRMSYAEEVTPEKKVVWHLDAPKGTEIHTLQPLGLDKVMLVRNGLPAHLMIIDKRTGAVEADHVLPDTSLTDPKTVHGQFRRTRVTAQGTYLVPYLTMNKVVEYDKDLKEVWSYKVRSPWAAVRLHNGNTLITDEHDNLTLEVNPKGETVWQFNLAELPPEIVFPGSQSCVRLANGNTILCSRGDGGKGCQLVEITPDKKLAWALKDWKTFGPATAVQILDEPGVPEIPGDLQR